MKKTVGKDYIGLGCGAVIIHNKKILLLKRSKKLTSDRTTAGLWSVPGGEVEFGERIEDAVKREVKEELGVEIEIQKPIGHWDQILPKSKIHWHCVAFLCQITKGKPRNLEPDKVEEVRWFPVSQVPKDSGIAHVVAPLHKLGFMSDEEFIKRLKKTPES